MPTRTARRIQRQRHRHQQQEPSTLFFSPPSSLISNADNNNKEGTPNDQIKQNDKENHSRIIINPQQPLHRGPFVIPMGTKAGRTSTTTTPTTATTTTNIPKNEMAGDAHTNNPPAHATMWLGLKRAEDHENPSAACTAIIPLRPQGILGRNPKTPMADHVDLGLTVANAKHVSKKACWVESVTATELVLRIPHDVFIGNYYKPLVCRHNSNKSNKGEVVVDSERVVLHPGDTFIFQTGKGYPNHPFQVVPIAASTSITTTTTTTTEDDDGDMPVTRAKQAAKALEGRRTTRSRGNHSNSNGLQAPTPASPAAASVLSSNLVTSPTATSRRTKRTARKTNAAAASFSSPPRPAKKERLSLDQTVAATPAIARTKDEASFSNNRSSSSSNEPQPQPQLSFLRKGETPYEFPWNIHVPAAVPNKTAPTNDTKEVKALTHPEKEQVVVAQRDDVWRATMLKAIKDETKRNAMDLDSDNSDSEDEEEEEDVPAFFRTQDMHVSLANSYRKALTSSETPAMGASLLNMLLANRRLPTLKLCGELVELITFGHFHTNKTTEPVPYWDPNRLQWAYQYVEAVLYRHPEIAYDRFGEAAGSDYWQNVLEQLYTLPYLDDDLSTAASTTTTTEASLQLHVMALKLFHRLVYGMIHRPGPTASGSPIIRDMDAYGGKAACRLAATAAAHIWVEFGSHLWELSSSTSTSTTTNSSMASVVLELTNLLSSIQVLMLDKFVLSNNDSKQQLKKEAVDILWNALDGKLQTSERRKDKEWVRNLKLLWIESWGRQDLEEALAKRLRMVQK